MFDLIPLKSFACRSLGIVALGLLAAAYSTLSTAAGCGWSIAGVQFPASGATAPSMVFDVQGKKMLFSRTWYNDDRYPVGSLMGIDSSTATQYQLCNQLNGAQAQTLVLVYEPPPGAMAYSDGHGPGFRIPTSVAGVAMGVQFPSAVPYPPGLRVSMGSAPVFGTTLPPNSMAPFTITLSVVKTGSFTAQHAGSHISVPGGLGRLRYATGNGFLSFDHALSMPTIYSGYEDGRQIGSASAPYCAFTSLGNRPFSGVAPTITLGSVRSLDFTAPGSIDLGSRAAPLIFSCRSSGGNNRTTVTFQADFPGGADGVGLPKADSEVGIQLLINDVPAVFGRPLAVTWIRTPFTPTTDKLGNTLANQGRYCTQLTNCSTDTTSPDWVLADSGVGSNSSTPVPVTLKYFQTGNQRPAPGRIRVPFTVTIDIQ
jgi:hypothetical protein